MSVLWMIVPLMVLAGSCTSVSQQDQAYLQKTTQGNEAAVPLSAEDSLKKHVLAKKLKKDPLMLDELVAADVKLVLGRPALERKEGANKALHYQSYYCIIDVYYAASERDESNIVKPAYINMLPIKPDTTPIEGADTLDKSHCINSVL